MSKTVRLVNEIGVGMEGGPEDRIKDIRVFVEHSSVQLWIELSDGREYLQYLDPASAMAFSHAFERCAVVALREATKLIE